MMNKYYFEKNKLFYLAYPYLGLILIHALNIAVNSEKSISVEANNQIAVTVAKQQKN